jgi:hypothetical protein
MSVWYPVLHLQHTVNVSLSGFCLISTVHLPHSRQIYEEHFANPVVIEHRFAKHLNSVIPVFKFWLTHFILCTHTKCPHITESRIVIETNLSFVFHHSVTFSFSWWQNVELCYVAVLYPALASLYRYLT